MAVPKLTRKQVNKRAHALGMTQQGYVYWKLRGGQRALAERMEGGPRGLKAQAQKELKTSYAPVFENLSKREGQVKALDEKRAADEKHYQAWVVNTQRDIVAAAGEREGAARAERDKTVGALTARLKEIQAPSQYGGGTPGSGTAGIVNAAATAAVERQAVANRRSEDVATISRGAATATQQNTLAFMALQSAKRQAQTFEKLLEGADAKDKALLAQASDMNRRLSQLLEGEVQKAQLRIGESQFNTKLQQSDDEFRVTSGISQQNADTSADSYRERVNARKARGLDVPEGTHGFTKKEWNSFGSAKRRRIIARDKSDATAPGKNKGPNRRQIGTGNTQIRGAEGVVRNPDLLAEDLRDAAGDKPKYGSKNGKPFGGADLSAWLQKAGYPKVVADVVAFRATRPGKKLPGWLRRALRDHQLSLPS